MQYQRYFIINELEPYTSAYKEVQLGICYNHKLDETIIPYMTHKIIVNSVLCLNCTKCVC